jgi:NitT/TauT family transport system ATP-binding protein
MNVEAPTAVNAPLKHPLTAASPEAAVAIEDLAFVVNDRRGRRTEIISGVNLRLEDREFVSIVGPSGCGKSTLLNFISGLLPVQSGRVSLFGEAPGGSTSVGYMFQQHGLLPWRTIIENVELGLELAGVAKPVRQEKARVLLAELGLGGFEDHYPNELSGGMRQRASLARTLIADPAIILMDEPFGALDAQTKVLMQELFSRYWNDHRKTVLFVTHDIAEAIALSDRVVVMSARPGRITAEYRVDLERPRDFNHLRADQRFNALHEEIWSEIRREATISMRGRT